MSHLTSIGLHEKFNLEKYVIGSAMLSCSVVVSGYTLTDCILVHGQLVLINHGVTGYFIHVSIGFAF